MMYLAMEDKNVYTVADIFAQNKSDNKKMLSDYPADFWQAYRNNSGYFDRRFKVMFKSWFPYDQDAEEGRESVADDFRFDVYSHLMANDKRYSELYRVNVIPDDTAYSLTNNVDYTETYEEATHNENEVNKGQQTDTNTSVREYGEQTVTDTNVNEYGEQEVVLDSDVINGQREDTNIHSRSAYNDGSGFQPTEKDENTTGEQSVYTDDTTTYGAHDDTLTKTVVNGSHDDTITDTRVEGTRKDTAEDDGTKEYTLHKVGNMGVQTVDDMLLKHWENWSLFDFYGLIFKEIARDLLRGC